MFRFLRPPRILVLLLACAAAWPQLDADPLFRRGDPNLDDVIDIADPVFVLSYLFGRGAVPECLDAADANDDGAVDIADPIMLLSYLFGGLQPQIPLGVCTPDLTPDELPPCTAGPVSCAEGSTPQILEIRAIPGTTLPLPGPGERFHVYIALSWKDADGDADSIETTRTGPGGAATTRLEALSTGGAEGILIRRESFDASAAPGSHRMTFVIGDASGNRSLPAEFTVLLDAGAPRTLDITGLSPATARPGETIRILGTGFDGQEPGRNAVTFAGGVRAVPFAGTPEELDVIVPPGSIGGAIAVENALGKAVSPLAISIPPAITISPRPASMIAGASTSFTASFGGMAPAPVTWTLEGMRVLLAGYGSWVRDGRTCTYTAPIDLPPVNPLHLRCELSANAAVYDEIEISVVLPEPTAGTGLVRASTGGSIVSLNGLVGLSVPAGGLSADTTISLETLDPASLPDAPADHMVVAAARFAPAGVTFQKLVGVDLTLRAWEQAGRALSILYRDPQTGKFVDTGALLQLDSSGLRGKTAIEHFSEFAVARPRRPEYLDLMSVQVETLRTRWAALFAFSLKIPPGWELYEGLSVPVHVVPSSDEVRADPVGPFHDGVRATLIFREGDVREVPVPQVQPSSDGWELGLVLPIPVLPDCQGELAGPGGTTIPAGSRHAVLRLAYGDGEYYEIGLTVRCLCELDLPPADVAITPRGIVRPSGALDPNRYAYFSLLESALGYTYRFSRIRLAEGTRMGWIPGVTLACSSEMLVPLAVEVTGDVEIAGALDLRGWGSTNGLDGIGNNDGGDGGQRGLFHGGPGGSGGPWVWIEGVSTVNPENVLCSSFGGLTACVVVDGASGTWCHSAWHGWGGVLWEKPSTLGALFDLTEGITSIMSGDIVGAAGAFYDLGSQTVRFLKYNEGLDASTGGGGQGGASHGLGGLPVGAAEIAGFWPPQGGGGGGGSGKAVVECGLLGIDFCKDKAGGGGGGGGGGAVNLRLVAGGTLTIAATGRIDGAGGQGGKGGDGTDREAAPGGGGGGGRGAQILIVARELANNGLITGAGGLGGPSGAFEYEGATILIPKGFGTRGSDGLIRIDEWGRGGAGGYEPVNFHSVYKGPRVGKRISTLESVRRSRADTAVSATGEHTETIVLGDFRYRSEIFKYLNGSGTAAIYYYQPLLRHAGAPGGVGPNGEAIPPVVTFAKAEGGLAEVAVTWRLVPGLNVLDLRVNRETVPIAGPDKGPFVELHPWERHYVFWFPGLADADADGLSDGLEIRLGTDIRIADTDLDGVDDWDEVFRYRTDPLHPPGWGGPDLIVRSIALSPDRPQVNVELTISATIRNVSTTAAAGATTTGCVLTNALGGSRSLGARAVPALAPEASFVVRWTFTPAFKDAGSHVAAVTADAGDAVLEHDETNNELERNFTISL